MEKYLRIRYGDLKFQDYWVLNYEVNKMLNILMYECYNEKEQVITKIIELNKVTAIEVYEDGSCVEIIESGDK